MSQTKSYEQRIREQVAQYAETIDMHALPDIFHVWSNEFLAPAIRDVFGHADINETYGEAIEAGAPKGRARVLSIGCGDGLVEIDVAKRLTGRGYTDFEIVCADVSPILLGRLSEYSREAGLQKHVRPIEADLNDIAIDGTWSTIMANHSLHHIEGLERLFDYSRDRLRPGGVFATCDMIGRNGHQRWPEAAGFVRAFWPLLKPEQRYHAQLQRYDAEWKDHDCSTEGFEGIRAQDILPLLLDRFHPARFVAAGGFIDPFVDRGYGHGFNAKAEADVALIRAIATMNDTALDAGLITPTWMLAWFTKEAGGARHFRKRTARRSVRQTLLRSA